MAFKPSFLLVSTSSGIALYRETLGGPRIGMEDAELLSGVVSALHIASSEFVGDLKRISIIPKDKKLDSRIAMLKKGKLNFALKYEQETEKADLVHPWLEKLEQRFRESFITERRAQPPQAEMKAILKSEILGEPAPVFEERELGPVTEEELDALGEYSRFASFSKDVSELKPELYELAKNAPVIERPRYTFRENGLFYLLKCEEMSRTGETSGPGEMAVLYFPPNASVEMTNTFHALSNFAEGMLNEQTDRYHCVLDFEKGSGKRTSTFVVARSKSKANRRYSNLVMAYTDKNGGPGLTRDELIGECKEFMDSNRPVFEETISPPEDIKLNLENLQKRWHEKGLYTTSP